jgi:hypothetical protein
VSALQLALHNAQSAQAGSLPAAHLAVLQLHAAAAAAPRQSAAAWLAPAPASVPRGRRCGAAAAAEASEATLAEVWGRLRVAVMGLPRRRRCCRQRVEKQRCSGSLEKPAEQAGSWWWGRRGPGCCLLEKGSRGGGPLKRAGEQAGRQPGQPGQEQPAGAAEARQRTHLAGCRAVAAQAWARSLRSCLRHPRRPWRRRLDWQAGHRGPVPHGSLRCHPGRQVRARWAARRWRRAAERRRLEGQRAQGLRCPEQLSRGLAAACLRRSPASKRGGQWQACMGVERSVKKRQPAETLVRRWRRPPTV